MTILASHWRSGDSVYLRVPEGSHRLLLGDDVGGGRSAAVFTLEEHPTELAKLYVGPGPHPDLHLLGRHLNRALGRVTEPTAGAPLLARPTLELYEHVDGGAVAGFVMHRFGDSPEGWSSLEQAGYDPSLRKSAHWCLEVARRIARDVAYFHRRSLIVGDLSDTNIRVTRCAKVAWVDVDSFGSLASGGLAALGAVGSTPECRAPELIKGQREGTQQSDRFALALQILRLLTCRFVHPFDVERTAGSARTIEDRVEDQDSWMLEASAFKTAAFGHPGVAGWPPRLAQLTRRALGGKPDDWPNADEWVQVLESLESEVLDEAFSVRALSGQRTGPVPTRGPGRRLRIARRHIVAVTGMAVLVLAVVIARSEHASAPQTPEPAARPVAPRSERPDRRVSTAAERKLLATIPSGAQNCRIVDTSVMGARAMARCSHTNISNLTYRLFRSKSQMNDYFEAQAALHGASRNPQGDCPRNLPASSTWTYTTSDTDGGRKLCYIAGGTAHLEWTRTAKHLYIHASRNDGSMRSLDRTWLLGNLE